MSENRIFLYKIIHALLFFLVFVFFTSEGQAQVKIGDNPEAIDDASVLELESTSKALVVSRVTMAQMQEMTPLAGALVYNTDASCLYYFNANTWKNLCSGGTDGNDGNDGGNGNDGNDGSGDCDKCFSLVDNQDGTYTVDSDTNSPFTFNGAPDKLTVLVNNEDGTYTYIDEIGGETLISTGIVGGEHIGDPGSVFFANSLGSPTGDNSQFFWDNENKYLGIGTRVPENPLHVIGQIQSGRFSSGPGVPTHASYNFQNDIGSGMFSPEFGIIAFSASQEEVVRIRSDKRVGINVVDPKATLHVGGDLIVDGDIITNGSRTLKNSSKLSSKIRKVAANKVALTTLDYTVILEGTVVQISIPKADASNMGHIFIIKDLGGSSTSFNIPYRNTNNELEFTIDTAKVLWLQSDGTEWQQIN